MNNQPRPDVARVLSALLAKRGEVRISRTDESDMIKLRVVAGDRSLSMPVLAEAVSRSRGDRVARELEDLLGRFVNQLGVTVLPRV